VQGAFLGWTVASWHVGRVFFRNTTICYASSARDNLEGALASIITPSPSSCERLHSAVASNTSLCHRTKAHEIARACISHVRPRPTIEACVKPVNSLMRWHDHDAIFDRVYIYIPRKLGETCHFCGDAVLFMSYKGFAASPTIEFTDRPRARMTQL